MLKTLQQMLAEAEGSAERQEAHSLIKVRENVKKYAAEKLARGEMVSEPILDYLAEVEMLKHV